MPSNVATYHVTVSHVMLRCTVLGCAGLCCAVLCCAVLCCAVLCCAVPDLDVALGLAEFDWLPLLLMKSGHHNGGS